MSEDAWTGRGLYFDLLALVALLLAGVAIGLNIYGYLAAAATGGDVRRMLTITGFSLVAFILSYAWIAARLVRAGYREAHPR